MNGTIPNLFNSKLDRFCILTTKEQPDVDVIKLYLEEIWISSKLRTWKNLVMLSEPALKCENNAICKWNYT